MRGGDHLTAHLIESSYGERRWDLHDKNDNWVAQVRLNDVRRTVLLLTLAEGLEGKELPIDYHYDEWKSWVLRHKCRCVNPMDITPLGETY
jgi:hypothetical protein